VKPAFQKDDALLADISRARNEGRTRLWWLGQSGFLLHTRAATILFDPYLSDSLTKKYAATDKPHTRVTERVIAPDRLTGIDVITSSHNHTDHLDAETLLPLLAANPQAKLLIPRANRAFVLERLGERTVIRPPDRRLQAAAARHASLLPPEGGVPILPLGHIASALVEIDAGETVSVAGVEFHGVAAAHNTVERDEHGRCKFLGFVARIGGLTIYHSGDTLLHDGLIPALRPFSPDLALVPINGNKPERRVAGNLNGLEAAALSQAIGARLAVPHHYDMFEFNTASPEEFETECRRLGQKFCTLKNGEGMDL
jgi:L-ascorbate metabolism protein UlaG (beta-lactamase superfamily)